MSIESYQTQTYILIDSPSINDDSDDEALEILSNLYSTLTKDFLSHLEMRICWMSSPLTKSDRFFIDRLTSSIYIPPYPEHPVHVFMPCMGIKQNMDLYAQDSMMISDLRITCTTST